jgi:hypothetical protein
MPCAYAPEPPRVNASATALAAALALLLPRTLPRAAGVPLSIGDMLLLLAAELLRDLV